MTYNDFINKLIEYYGKPQNKIVNDAIMSWVIKNFKENNNSLNLLLVGIIKKHKYNFGFPDLASMIEIYDDLVNSGNFIVKVFVDNKLLDFGADIKDSPLLLPDDVSGDRIGKITSSGDVMNKTLEEILKGEHHG